MITSGFVIARTDPRREKAQNLGPRRQRIALAGRFGAQGYANTDYDGENEDGRSSSAVRAVLPTSSYLQTLTSFNFLRDCANCCFGSRFDDITSICVSKENRSCSGGAIGRYALRGTEFSSIPPLRFRRAPATVFRARGLRHRVSGTLGRARRPGPAESPCPCRPMVLQLT